MGTRFSTSVFFLICAVLHIIGAYGAAAVNGTSKRDPRYVEIRSRHEAELQRELSQLTEAYRASLERLLTKFEQENRTRDASAVRSELKRLRGRSGETIDFGASLDPGETILFHASDATSKKAVKREAASGHLIGWRAGESIVSWSYTGLAPGGYEVYVNLVPGSAAKLRLSEPFFQLQRDIHAATTAAPRRLKRVHLGTLKVSHRSGRIQVECLSAGSSGISFAFKSIELVPNLKRAGRKE